MPIVEPSDELMLPEGARLLHIGPMKTGTTALQAAARRRRRELLDHGLRYPGKRLNHRAEVGALFGWNVHQSQRAGPVSRKAGSSSNTGGVPPREKWDQLKAEIDADTTRRVLVTHEFISRATDRQARRIVDELDPDRVHVAITLRSPSAILPSLWVQGLKASGQTEPFDDWVARIYGENAGQRMSSQFHRAHDQGKLVARWARIVGPEKVTVVVADKTRPNLLTDAFENLLGLPANELAHDPADQHSVNRSLTAVEAELFRRLNITLRDEGVDWNTYQRLDRNGAIRRLLDQRVPPADEPRLCLPAWAAKPARQEGERFAERIRQSGVRVIGDLDNLHAEPPAPEQVNVDQLPIDIGVDALAGALIAGQKAQTAAAKRARKLANERGTDSAERAPANPTSGNPAVGGEPKGRIVDSRLAGLLSRVGSTATDVARGIVLKFRQLKARRTSRR